MVDSVVLPVPVVSLVVEVEIGFVVEDEETELVEEVEIDPVEEVVEIEVVEIDPVEEVEIEEVVEIILDVEFVSTIIKIKRTKIQKNFIRIE